MRLIDADRYKWEIENACGLNAPVQKDVIRFCSRVVDNMPTVEPYKRDVQRKPLYIPIDPRGNTKDTFCPICKQIVFRYYFNFCCNCGQAIDWSEEE